MKKLQLNKSKVFKTIVFLRKFSCIYIFVMIEKYQKLLLELKRNLLHI